MEGRGTWGDFLVGVAVCFSGRGHQRWGVATGGL